ncbi:MAG: hypothetical protein Q4D57_02670, partial [Clostridia bacterium]|nr:hypothetical protein [Clostridia bacterium]
MANDKIKSVNTKELQNFEKALPPVFAASDTRKLVKAASKGNLEEYKDALKNYKWKFTRDYNVVLVILSVIVVAAQAINNHPKYQESDEYKKLSEKDKNALNKKIDDLKRRLDDLLAGSGSRRLLEVFKLIGSGKGTQLRADLNTFAKYRELVETLSEDNKYGQIDNPLIERASKISRWVVNKKYVNNKLLPYVTKLLGSKFASALR